jgi:hypothetical protein
MFKPSDGWQNVWFFPKNDANALLPVFTDRRPIPQPNWGYRVARKDLCRMQPLPEAVQQLLCRGLTGVDLLRTFFSHRVQPLHQWGTTMWMYLGPSYPDRPFFEELGDTEINTRICRVLTHVANLNLGAAPAPIREGVDSTLVSSPGPTFGCLCQFWFQMHSCCCAGSWVCSQHPVGVTLPKDTVRREANRAYSELLQAWR